MKKRILAVLLMILSIPGIFASSLFSSPLGSFSYYGRNYDFFKNPASLPLTEGRGGKMMVEITASDKYDGNSWSGNVPYINDAELSLGATFMTDSVALTVKIASESERASSDSFNTYSHFSIEINSAYSIWHFSFGAKMEAGNSMVRTDREVSNIADLLVEAWFSPFQGGGNDSYFNLGAGLLFFYSPFSLGVYVGKILTLDENDSVYVGWDAIGESTTLSVALASPRYNRSGDLRLLRPRASISVTGLSDGMTRTVEYAAEVMVQFFPDSDLTFAVSYSEGMHEWLNYKPENAYVSFAVRGGKAGFYGEINLSFRANDFSSFAPSLSFIYAK